MHKFFNTKITSGILTGLLIMLIVYSNHVDSRAISRKPPFNGSIFGKRSTIPANQGMEIYYASPQQPPAIINNKTSHVLASLLQQQQDASIRTAVNRCLAQYEITLGEFKIYHKKSLPIRLLHICTCS